MGTDQQEIAEREGLHIAGHSRSTRNQHLLDGDAFIFDRPDRLAGAACSAGPVGATPYETTFWTPEDYGSCEEDKSPHFMTVQQMMRDEMVESKDEGCSGGGGSGGKDRQSSVIGGGGGRRYGSGGRTQVESGETSCSSRSPSLSDQIQVSLVSRLGCVQGIDWFTGLKLNLH